MDGYRLRWRLEYGVRIATRSWVGVHRMDGSERHWPALARELAGRVESRGRGEDGGDLWVRGQTWTDIVLSHGGWYFAPPEYASSVHDPRC